MKLENVLKSLPQEKIKGVLEESLLSGSVFIDLSSNNPELESFDCLDSNLLNDYILNKTKENNGSVAVGGYLENRDRYQNSKLFQDNDEEPRSLHLAIDIWAPEGTAIFAPIEGRVHSFNNNANYFDYGPTIILTHTISDCIFHTLYGHLSSESLVGLQVGQTFLPGEKIGELGDSSVNGDWPPHLHFQIIKDMQGNEGDYPGVAKQSEKSFYQSNCPDPNLLLRLTCLM